MREDHSIDTNYFGQFTSVIGNSYQRPIGMRSLTHGTKGSQCKPFLLKMV
jgi:hypothetical protein